MTVSIVSHNQADIVRDLLEDIRHYCSETSLELILTLNLPEVLPFSEGEYPFPVKIIRNRAPQGFGENHNQASQLASGDFFCVLNPDIRIRENIFGPLMDALIETDHLGLVAPLVISPDGQIEDSARIFPTLGEIAGKLLGKGSHRSPMGSQSMTFPDWVAGMFMLFPVRVFCEIGGFDSRYFLYYEDVDLCARLKLAGYRTGLLKNLAVIHNARRTSHRNLKYLRWHAASMLRFFLSDTHKKISRMKH